MHNLKAIRAMAVAIGVCMMTGCGGEALDCQDSECVRDQIYHGPLSKIELSGSNRPRPTIMYVGAYGWGAFKTSLPPDKIPATPHPVVFDKSYLEVDEKGQLFDPGQLQAFMDRIDELKKQKPTRPIFVFTYAHGWHHNASTPPAHTEAEGLAYNAIKFDYFMARFVEHVRRLYELNGDDNAPAMLGVYVGWRAKSTTDPLSNMINVGNRAGVADTIAANQKPASLYRALKQISAKVGESGPSSRMIATGHSLGGRLMSRMFLPEIAKGDLHPLGRHALIAAIEPAISASCYHDIYADPAKPVGKPGRLPSFIAITSTDDFAVVEGFRLGHLVGALDPQVCPDTPAAQNSAIGAYAPYVTHFWEFTRKGEYDGAAPQKECDPPRLTRHPDWLLTLGKSEWQYPYYDPLRHCPNMGGNYHTDGWAYELNVTRMDAYNQAGAVWNVQTDRNLIDDADDTARDGFSNIGDRHNGFSSTGLADMLGRIAYAQIRWQDEGSGGTVPEPSAKPLMAKR
jgi:hypothetical protein